MNSLTVNYWLKQHWKLLLVVIIAVLILGQTIFQIVYPGSRLIPGTKVDGVDVGGMKVEEAAKKLDGLYGELKLNIFFGKNEAAFQSPKMSDVGIGVDNNARLAAINYPFYLRIIPGSMYWAPALSKPGEISYTYDKNKIADYTQSKVGDDCSIPPQNASLKLIDSQLQLVPSATGGKCDITEFQQILAEVKPDSNKDNEVRIAIDEIAAPVTDDMARALAAKLNTRLAVPMPITVDATTDTIPGRVVLSWLDFKADVPVQSIDNTGNQSASLKYSINKDRMQDYLSQGIAAKLIKKPGVSHVTTLDFNETARTNGANGRGLDMVKAIASVENYISGKAAQATAATQVVGPTTVYTRNYTPTSVGFSALLAQYAQDNPGTYSMAFTELSGVSYPRSATYRGDARMPAGGIHSLYLAYTDVMQEYAGIARPVDKISGDTNAIDCFKDMLQRFDDGCRTGFYKYFGFATLTAQAKGLGLTNTVFANEDTLTSANDLQKVMVGLYKNQIGRIEGAQKILSALRAVQASDGIPAGAGAGQISHTIGENDTVHNDTAIVYSNNYGAYALTVLSDGASWDKVSGLAKKIQTLKAVKVPKDAR
jgi:beta-lactamase class A